MKRTFTEYPEAPGVEQKSQNIKGTENMHTNGASAQKEGIFVPSKEWQDVLDWADPLPPGGEYRVNIATGRKQARWNNPPGPHSVFDKRTGKNQTFRLRPDDPIAKTIYGDPEEWYWKELEKTLGSDRAQRWRNMTDEEFEALIIEIKEEAWESFPIEALPPVIGNLAKSIAVAHNSKDKMGVIALPMIGVLSGAIGQGIRVQTDRYTSYANLYVYCSVGSGGIKSVVIEEAEAPVIEYQKALFKRYEEEVKPETLADLRAIAGKIESLAAELEMDPDNEDLQKQLAVQYRMKSEAEKRLEFCPVKLEDVTPEAMVMHGINHGRVFISSDEGGIVADIVCGRYSKGFTNDGPFCKIWSSGNLSRKRKDGLIFRDRVTGTMLLMGQEHITEQMFQNESMVTSGFIPRFLFAAADTPMQRRDRNRKTVSEDARGNYRDVVIRVLQSHWDVQDEEAITIGMDEDAQNALDDFHNSYVDRANTTLADAKRSLHRIAEQATRIALIFHVAKVYGSMAGLESDVKDIKAPIGLSTVQNAIKVMDWALQSYLEYTQAGRENTLDELEIEVLSKSKKFSEPFTVRDMQRKARSKKLTGSEHLVSILDGLVKKGKLVFAAGKFSVPTKKA